MAVARYEAVRWPLRPKKVCEGRSLGAIIAAICVVSGAVGSVRLFEQSYRIYSCAGNAIEPVNMLISNEIYRNVMGIIGFTVLQAFGPIGTVLVFSVSLIYELRRARLEYVLYCPPVLLFSIVLRPARIASSFAYTRSCNVGHVRGGPLPHSSHSVLPVGTLYVCAQHAAEGEPLAGGRAPSEQSGQRDGAREQQQQPRQGGVGRPDGDRALRALLRARDAAEHPEHSGQTDQHRVLVAHCRGVPRSHRYSHSSPLLSLRYS